MGRVEEAMRRAAEEQSTQPTAAVVAPNVGITDISFPAEVPAGPELPVREATPVAGESPLPEIAIPPTAPPPVPPAVSEPDDDGPQVKVDGRLDGKLVADHAMPPGCREQYRRLAATLHHTQAAVGLKVVMIASAVAGEGKTLTAANLALTFSESYRRSVLLIDGDLRRPSLHTIFKIESTPGLGDGLMTTESGPLPVHQVSDCLAILPAGRPNSDPMAALTSRRMQQLVDEARRTFDWVIIDTPPVGLMTDANLLAAMADGTVLVVRAGTTPYQAAQRAIDAIGKDRLLGAVLNRATDAGPHGYAYGYEYKYYEYYHGRSEARADLE
jgi:receptor protein-tyrosine kinase